MSLVPQAADLSDSVASSADAVSAAPLEEKVEFKKKTKGRQGVRKRDLESDTIDDQDGNTDDRSDVITAIVRPAKKIHSATTVQAKTHEDINVYFQSNRSAAPSGLQDMGATATLEIDTEKDRDAEALYQKQLALSKDMKDGNDDGLYRGQSGYRKFLIKQDAEHGAKFRVGPQRAAGNIRSTTRFDYQPDVCKDYKETGFCGFGDSCKFVHDRSDYKSGWQLEREWESKTYGKQDAKEFEIESEDEDDALPFACLICRNEFTNPIVTRCGHYFCEKCALEEYRKGTKCFACGEKTLGLFSAAKDLLKKIAAKKKRQEEKDKAKGLADEESEGND